MDFSTSHYIQLIIALSAGIAIFVIAYMAQPKLIVPILIILTPFQLITSQYGTLNMVLIYLVGGALLLKGYIRSWPLAPAILLLCMAYLLSLTQADRGTYFSHIIYLVMIGSNFILFFIVYNYTVQTSNPKLTINTLIWLSALVSVYYLLSFFIGFDKVAVFGIDELTFGHNMEREQRLVGPYGSAGTNSEFLAVQMIFLLYIFMRDRSTNWKRIILPVLMMANFGFLVATGSRGGFITFLIGGILYLCVFRKQLGAKGILTISLMGTAFAVVALTVISFTDFNVLFNRLETTEIKGYEIDTRSGLLGPTLESISESPILGHGPRQKAYKDEWKNAPYPHNLYLFLPYTIGIVGLLAYLIFFSSLLIRFYQSKSSQSDSDLGRDIAKLAILLLIMFMVSQFRIEFLRFKLLNYQHYLFTLWAALLALTDLAKRSKIPSRHAATENNSLTLLSRRQ